MNISRRAFSKLLTAAGAVVAAGNFIGSTACNIYNDIMKYVPIALTAFSTIVSMIAPGEGTLIAGLVTMVKNALVDIQTAVTNYENAPASQKQTLSGKIATAITAAEQELQQFWNDLKLPDGNLATLIEGVLNIIISTLMAFLPSLAAPASLPMRAALTKKIAYTPKKRSLSEFKKDLNAQFIKTGYAPIFKA